MLGRLGGEISFFLVAGFAFFTTLHISGLHLSVRQLLVCHLYKLFSPVYWNNLTELVLTKTATY